MTKGGTNSNKDVIYIDVDDEITGVIDKVRASQQKIVAVVLPKRAAVLQSVVNMKLLKRATDDAKKNVVLITADHNLLPLAGSVGLHVAKSLSSRPEVPDAPAAADESTETVEEAEVDDAELDKTRSVGDLSGDREDDTIELDEEAAEDGAGAAAKAKSKLKQFKIPNFNKFRLLLMLGGVGILLLGGVGYAAVAVLPKAQVVIKTDRTSATTNATLTLKTGADVTVDATQGIVPVESQEVKKTLTQQVPATGQINKGDKATGSVKLTLTDCSKDQVSVPAGTGLSSGGKTFITKSSATLQSVKVGSNCKNADFPSFSTKTVDVQAQTGGSGYNIAAASFTVAGYSNVSGQSSAAMSGGTDNLAKVITQTDIDGAKQKIGEQESGPIQQELKSALIGRGLFAIDVTFGEGTPEVKLSGEVNTEAENVTVTQTTTYSMLGAKQSNLQTVLDQKIKDDIDTTRQAVLDYGLDKATFAMQAMNPDGATVTVETTVVAGAELNLGNLKKQIAGKKAHEAKDIIGANPGVKDVSVSYSPFWVSTIPKNIAKITITVQEPQTANAESP